MSLVITFYAGDAKALCKAFNADDSVVLKQAAARADFSLNLDLEEIDDLSKAAFSLAGRSPRTLFRKDLDDHVGLDAESGAYKVESGWVKTVAGIGPDQGKALATQWARDSDAGLKVTKDVIAATTDLLSLCRQASAQGLDVVFTWSL